jgi:hypothetical protein
MLSILEGDPDFDALLGFSSHDTLQVAVGSS